MNELALTSRVVDAIGWTLLHSLWQGTALGLLAGGILARLENRPAEWRYSVATVALAAIPAAAIVTLAATWNAPSRGERPPAQSVAGRSSTGRVEPRDGTEAPSESAKVLRGGQALQVRPALPTSSVSGDLPLNEPKHPLSASIAPWLHWLVGVWTAGALLSAGRLTGGAWKIRRMRRWGTSPVPPEVQQILERLTAAMRLRGTVILRQSSLAGVPMVLGYLRPVILAPAGVIAGLSAAELEAILAHELMHVRRHDALVNAIQAVLETLFFYHPAVWWLSRTMREERENCCDDAAMAFLGSRVSYGRALVALEQLRHPALDLALAATGGTLLARIRRIAGVKLEERLPRGAASGGLLIGAVLLAGSLWWIANGQAQSAPTIVEAAADDFVILGTVLELRSDSPIVSAEVTCRLPHYRPTAAASADPNSDPEGIDYRSLGTSWLEDQEPIWSRTFRADAQGQFEIRIPRQAVDTFQREWTRQDQLFEGFIPHVIGVTARAPGYLPIRPGTYLGVRQKNGSDAAHTCQLLLTRSVELRGRFVTPDGQPAANVPVMVARNRDGFGDSTGIGFWTRTDAEGRFTLETQASWPQRLHWFPGEFASDSRATTRNFGDQGVIVLKRGTRLSGVIENENGEPLAGFAIKATTGTRVPHLYARSDSAGRFSFPPLPAGDYRLQAVDHFVDNATGARFSGTLPQTFVPVRYSLGASEGPPVVIRPSSVRLVRFRVIDADGNPLEGRTIHASIAGNHVQSRPVEGEPGRYVVPTPDWDQPCEFQIGYDRANEAVLYQPTPESPRMPGWSVTRRHAPKGDPEITIQLLRAASIGVEVRTEDGTPLRDARCEVHYSDAEDFREHGIFEGPVGAYLLNAKNPKGTWRGLAPGHRLTITVSASGAVSHEETVELQPGEQKRLDVVMTPPRTSGERSER